MAKLAGKSIIIASFFYLANSIVAFEDDGIDELARDAEQEKSQSYFVADSFHSLDVNPIASRSVLSSLECSLACLRVVTCFSLNVAVNPDIEGLILCELLPTDKYNSSEKIITNPYFHHYSICAKRSRKTDPVSSCSQNPCENGGKYVAFSRSLGDFKCICSPGFHGNRCEADVDECKERKHRCSSPLKADCQNTDGSYNCKCRRGYQGDGIICTDVNECREHTHTCSSNDVCQNVDGSFYCDCDIASQAKEVNRTVNLALDKPAKQSSTPRTLHHAGRAVDGYTNNIIHYCTYTNKEVSPWWRVDLGSVKEVAEVKIWNRGYCCGNRLTNFMIIVENSTEDSSSVAAVCGHNLSVPTQHAKCFSCSPALKGRFVEIQIQGEDKILTLCEVQVFGAVHD